MDVENSQTPLSPPIQPSPAPDGEKSQTPLSPPIQPSPALDGENSQTPLSPPIQPSPAPETASSSEDNQQEDESDHVMSEIHLGCPPKFSGSFVSHFTFSLPPACPIYKYYRNVNTNEVVYRPLMSFFTTPQTTQQPLFANPQQSSPPPFFTNPQPLQSIPNIHYSTHYSQVIPPTQPSQPSPPVTQPSPPVTQPSLPVTQPSPPVTQPSPYVTQPSQSAPKRKHKKKQADEGRKEKTIERWTAAEELALAQAWLDISENPIIGDGQSGSTFWNRVRDKFHLLMGRDEEYRGADKISGKWTAMRTRIAHFNNIHIHVSNNRNLVSGSSDLDIMSEAQKQFRMERGASFSMIEPWELLRKSPKFHQVVTLNTGRSSKRSKTSSSPNKPPSQGASNSPSHVNLNDSDDELNFDEPDELPCPMGRDQSKAGARGKATSSSTSTMNPEIKAHMLSIDEKLADLIAVKRDILSTLNDRQKDNDLKFLAKNFSHLPPADQAIMEARKEEIRAKYRA